MKTLTIHENDTVEILLEDMETAEGRIPKGHKLASRPIQKGENVIKYGYPIGHATCDIPQGAHVHIHNIKTNLGEILEYTYQPNVGAELGKQGTDTSSSSGTISTPPGTHIESSTEGNTYEALPTFMGYRRSDGRVGVRNEIWIVNTVGCVNKLAENIAREAEKSCACPVFAYSHPFGCSQMGEDQENTQKILAAMVNHPNAGGVLVLGLGCENNNVAVFKKVLGEYDPRRVKFLIAQEAQDEMQAALDLIEELSQYALTAQREEVPLSELCIGLKCGGSDGFSGITANPLVGRVSDRICAAGGTALLTEVPEMFGAETILMNRCVNEGVFKQTVDLINNFKQYFTRHNQEIYENPSPGNKEGGISTLEDKSLGCTQKGGTSLVTGVYGYGELCQTKGLNLVNSPGNDIVAITALMAAGAQIILFTTGRGTPVGAPVPTLKIATNSAIFHAKPNWFDYNTGNLLEGMSFEEAAEGLLGVILEVASGKEAKNELHGYREISIFKDGVIL